MEGFNRKLMKFWIQSFLLGVPRIVVGFRTRDGVLVSTQDIETHRIPETVNAQPNPKWNADMCVNFAATLLECMSLSSCTDNAFAELTLFARANTEHQRRGRLENTASATVANYRAVQGGGDGPRGYPV